MQKQYSYYTYFDVDHCFGQVSTRFQFFFPPFNPLACVEGYSAIVDGTFLKCFYPQRGFFRSALSFPCIDRRCAALTGSHARFFPRNDTRFVGVVGVLVVCSLRNVDGVKSFSFEYFFFQDFVVIIISSSLDLLRNS